MRILMAVLGVGLVIFLFGILNYFIGRRGWQTIGKYIPRLNRALYWTIFWLIALSYFLARLGEKFLPTGLNKLLTIVGSYWLAAMLYSLMILVIIDLIRLLDRWFHFIPEKIRNKPFYAGIIVLLIVVGILVYGTWNALNPRITHYELTIPKKANNIKKLHVVFASDLHLGMIVNNDRLEKFVAKVNQLNPDIVLLPGDIIDESVETFLEQNMSATLSKLHPKYGTYAALGNHEYISGRTEEAIKYYEKAGIKVLRDSDVKVADSFYVIGRDDRSADRHGGKGRKSLSALVKNLNTSLPLILIDHQPFNLGEAEKNGIDLQLSGHTHGGQLFPDRLITGRMYEIDWGYLRKGNTQYIVTSGYGTWGPPIRTGNYPEIVDLKINFK